MRPIRLSMCPIRLSFSGGRDQTKIFQYKQNYNNIKQSLCASQLYFTISSLKCSLPEEQTHEYFQNLGQIVLKSLKITLLSVPYM